jgi:RpiR family carbohydrate utilization transcriptional regulator
MAVDTLVRAKQIMLYGIGGSSIIVYAAHHLLAKAGLSCGVYTDGYMQTVTASMMNAESVALGVSNTGMSKHVVDALDIAASKGAITIGITSNRDSALARASKICLVTPPGGRDIPLYGGSIEAKVCQLYILDLLYLGILFKLGNVTKKNLKETANALRTYYNPINYDMSSNE